MKRLMISAALIAATLSTPTYPSEVLISINIGQPGFYGRLDLASLGDNTDYPQPQVIYQKPIIIEQGSMNRQPIYLRVPPGHARHWRQHCHEYRACDEQVLFVRNKWYKREFLPRYQEQLRIRHNVRRDEHRDIHVAYPEIDRQGCLTKAMPRSC